MDPIIVAKGFQGPGAAGSGDVGTHAETVGDLLVAEHLHDPQLEDLPLVRGQERECVLEMFPGFFDGGQLLDPPEFILARLGRSSSRRPIALNSTVRERQ